MSACEIVWTACTVLSSDATTPLEGALVEPGVLKVIEKVRSVNGDARAASAQVMLESSPPLR